MVGDGNLSQNGYGSRLIACVRLDRGSLSGNSNMLTVQKFLYRRPFRLRRRMHKNKDVTNRFHKYGFMGHE